MAFDREAIRRRCEAATPGPWDKLDEPFGKRGAKTCIIWARSVIVCRTSTAFLDTAQSNAEFIAHARADIPALLARLDAADALRAALDDVRRQWAAGMGDARAALDAVLAAYDGEREGCDDTRS